MTLSITRRNGDREATLRSNPFMGGEVFDNALVGSDPIFCFTVTN